MGAKAAAVRKGALVPASPKGKAKKKPSIEGNGEDAIMESHLADKIIDNTADNNVNTTAVNNNNSVNSNINDNDEEAQEDQAHEQELDSSPGREANTPKINFSEQSKARRSLRHSFHKCYALLTLVSMLFNGSQQAHSRDTCCPYSFSINLVSNNTNQSANRTRSEFALTQTNFPTAH
eukprot:1014884-Pleurochrysis_carterae.AAC.1